MNNFVDRAVITGARATRDGFLVADCHIARSGIQRYLGVEVGCPELQYVDVYRPPEAVFDQASLLSFSHIPITIEHPSVPVTSDNWKELAVGEVSTEVLRDGERLKVPLVLKDVRAIEAVVAGRRQLSVGYSAELDFTPGVTPEGRSYQASQRAIRANHVAIVDEARAGPEFSIGDGNWGAPPQELPPFKPGVEPMNTPALPSIRGVVVDGLTIQTTDQGAEAIAKLQAAVQEANAQLATATTAHAAALAAKDTEIGELKVQAADALKKVPTAEALDTLAQARASLIGDAKRLAKDIKTEGLTDDAIRLAAVTAVYGADLVKDSSPAEVAGMFKAALGQVKKDPVRDALRPGSGSFVPDGQDHGQSGYEKRLSDGWKGAKTA
jgi:hypothetical protein